MSSDGRVGRRALLEAATGAAALMAAAAAEGAGMMQNAGAGRREYYELRRYTFADAAKRDRYSAFLASALLPAAGRHGAGPIGVFSPDGIAENKLGDAAPSLYTIAAYPSIEAFAGAESELLRDAAFREAGRDVLDLPATDPPYAHLESSLLVAFTGMPKLSPPREAGGNQPRIFELRTYESHSRRANLKKIEMFNSGEIGIFQRAGFQPVFFGEALSGPQLPNLTYMVTYANMEQRAKLWGAFGADPEKTRLFAIPEYADKLIVSKIRSVFLKPLPGSQI
jgi:hypothetical protein